MKKAILFRNIALLLLSFGSPALVQGASLLEVYQQALQSDPLIHEAESRRQAALEAAPQARALLLPQISAGAQYSSSNFDGSSAEGGAGGTIASVTSESSTTSTGWTVDLRQTLFRWDQWVGLRKAEKQVAKAQVNYEAAQQDLIVRVVTRYFNVLAAEDQLTSIHADRTAIARQLEQAKQRFEVGLIAITDVQESQAAYDQAVANEIGSKRSLATAREFLREITGEYIRILSAPDDDFPLTPPNPASEASWNEIAMAQNLALVSSRFDEQIARDEIAFRRSGHYPTLDLVANISSAESEITDQVRNSIQFPDIDTDGNRDSISIQLSIPIF
ncbi:MAG: TolC family protein, partial [Proteobacteria bacterium]|nr:TolC family protein [Pseudomonadota bacterium]